MNLYQYTLVVALFLIASLIQAQSAWTYISQPGPTLQITSETTGYSYTNQESGSHGSEYTLRKSTDGLHTFHTIRSNSGNMGCYELDGMFYLNSDTGFIAEICQANARIYRTTNGGIDWTNLAYGGAYGLAMYYLSDTLGYYTYWPGGPNSSVLMKSGSYQYSTFQYYFYYSANPASSLVTDIEFVNDSTGFIICNDTLGNAVILKTTNYGTDWSEVKSDSNSRFKDLYFVSPNLGFVVGTNGNILRTTDIGENWESINSGLVEALYSIDFSDDGVGYIVGSNGTLLRSIDNGDTWTSESFATSANLIYVRSFANETAFINDAEGKLYTNNDIVGISEIDKDAFKVYPNPTNDILHVSIPESILYFNLYLYDLQGRQILESQDATLDLRDYSLGMYVLRIESNLGDTFKRIVKK